MNKRRVTVSRALAFLCVMSGVACLTFDIMFGHWGALAPNLLALVVVTLAWRSFERRLREASCKSSDSRSKTQRSSRLRSFALFPYS